MAFTYFFRDMVTLNIVQEHVFPGLRTHRNVRIWDAGCATGVEPYTLAILLREQMGTFGFKKVAIHATDLNGQFGKIIAQGVYSNEEVQRVPESILAAYFQRVGDTDSYMLDDSLRKSIVFTEHNLTTLKPIGDGFQLIICKNVLLHLAPDQRVNVIRMFHDSLTPGGYLAVEQTQRMPSEAEDWFKPVVGTGPVFQRT